MNDNPTSDTEAVLLCEAQLVQAQLSSDSEALARLLGDDLIFVSFAGELGNKSDDLNLHRSGRFKITRMQLLDRQVRDLGSTIVVVSLMDTAAVFDGTSMSKRLRYTRVWTKSADGWSLVVAHLTEMRAGL